MMPATTEIKISDDYLPVHVNTLSAEHCLDVELYIRDAQGATLRLYRGEGVPFETSDRQRLADNGVKMLYIRKSSHQKYQEYLRENMASVLDNENETVTARFTSLSEVVRDIMATAFAKDDLDNTVEQSADVADHCVKLLTRDDYAATELIGVLHHDYSTFTHSANVSFMSVMLAKELGISDHNDLCQIAVGGLLHDLGKLEVPDKILTKPAKLTDAEYDQIKEHARSGYRRLCRREDITFAQLMMAYQHHERVEGGGYPVGCLKSEIHDWARICTVIDVFEALTANRPYRPKLPQSEVVEIMQRGCGKVFDSEFLKCWLAVIKNK